MKKILNQEYDGYEIEDDTMIEIFPIDANGFVLWTSDRYRFENSKYRPKEDEIITPIPRDKVWAQPRWNGKKWVEGGRHPDEPEQEYTAEDLSVIAPEKRIDELEKVVVDLVAAVNSLAGDTKIDITPIAIRLDSKSERKR